jgi:hypothetical protein
MNKSWKFVGALAAVTLVAACGGNDSGTPEQNDAAGNVTVPGLGPGKSFSFDLGTVVNGKYYLTDRTNKSVDVVDVNTLALSLIKGTGSLAFAGAFADNGISGPDGINAIPGTTFLFVGDVNNVRVVDAATGTVQSTIVTGNTGVRADEGCVDPDHNLYMIATPDAAIPYASIISIPTHTVVATIRWVDTDGNAAGGNEQCQYDHASQSFLVNNDNTIANPHGEVDVIPVASIAAIPAGTTVNVFSLPNVKRFPLGNCDPTGLALGPGTEMASECRQGDAGAALTTLIMDRNTGAIIATVPSGGGDQVAYDARTNRYYVAASRWHTSGKNDLGGGCSATNVCAPMLFVIDAASHAVVAHFNTGNNAHSVAVDPVTGEVFVPYSSATNPAGCGTCTANGFINGGISVFAL